MSQKRDYYLVFFGLLFSGINHTSDVINSGTASVIACQYIIIFFCQSYESDLPQSITNMRYRKFRLRNLLYAFNILMRCLFYSLNDQDFINFKGKMQPEQSEQSL